MLRRIILQFVLFALVVMTQGCGGGGGGGIQAPALNPPSQVMARPAAYYGSFSVSWSEPSPTVDGYELEAKVGPSDFQKIVNAKIPSGTTNLNVTLNANLTELTTVVFRLRSVRESAFSNYSNEAQSKFPLKAPSYLSAYFVSTAGSMRLTWDNDSTLASTVRIEKAVLTGNLPGNYSTVFEGPVSVQQATDSALAEDVVYRYRISVQGQGESSVFATTDSYPIALLPPTGFTASGTLSGAHLSWQGVSPKAVELQVQRGNGLYYSSFTTIASVPVGSTQYADSGIASGFYTYRLVVKSASQTAYSIPTTFITLPTGTGLALSTSLRTMPSGIRAMAAWGDAPALLTDGTDAYSYVVTPPVGATWPTHTIFNVAAVSQSGFTLDSHGLPHVLFRRDMGTGYPTPQAVIHEWFNGTTWISEELFREKFSGTFWTEVIYFALGPNGVVHAVWQPDTSTGYTIWYGTNRSGTWESTRLQPNQGSIGIGLYRVAVDSTGTAYVAIGLWDKVSLFSRPPGINTFSQEIVPTGPVNARYVDALELRPFGSRVALFYEREVISSDFVYFEMCLIKGQGQWGQPTQLVVRTDSSTSTVTKSAASAVSGRLVFSVNMPTGLQVFTFKADETWDSVILAPSGGYNSPTWIGFNNQEKVWCAIHGGSGSDYSTDIYAWYQE